MKELLSVLFSKTDTDYPTDGNRRTSIYGSIFFVLVAAILTALNIYKGFWFMAGSTTALVVGFSFAALLAHKNKITASRIVTAVLCAFIFSYYAISGQNDGFAILWIILIPVISSLLVGLRIGFFLGLYFQLFLVVLFYTPLSGLVAAHYSETFLMRFPLLYFASFGAITFLMCQRQMLYNVVHKQAYYDDMTGLFNRRRYNEVCRNLEKTSDMSALCVVSLDANRLKYVNDTIGHEAGDAMLIEGAHFIADAFEGDTCCRIGGDEFVVISHRGKSQVQHSVKKLQQLISAQDNTKENTVNLSFGCAFAEDHPEMNFNELSLLSDQEMYADKARFYRENGIDRRR